MQGGRTTHPYQMQLHSFYLDIYHPTTCNSFSSFTQSGLKQSTELSRFPKGSVVREINPGSAVSYRGTLLETKAC